MVFENEMHKLYDAIKNSDLEEISILFEQIYSVDDSVMNRFILYLMNDIYKLSDSLIKSAKEIDLDSIKLNESDNISRTYNNIFYHSICKKDNKSLYIANNFIENKSIQDDIMCYLLEKRWKKMRYQISQINLLVRQKKYSEVIEFIEKFSIINNLEKNILVACKKYVEISTNNKIPSIDDVDTNRLTDAIEANNFKRAYKLCVDYNNKNFILKENSAILIILEDILKLMHKINNISYNEVLDSVKNNSNNIFEITNIIDKYLESIGKSKYSSIVLDNLKLDVLNNDNKYTNFRKICTSLEHDNYVYYLDYYVKQFYIEIGHNNINNASTYLDIIYNGVELGYDCPIINLLEDVLKYTKKFFNREKIELESTKELYIEENKEETNEEIIDVEEDNDIEMTPINCESIINTEDIKYINGKFDKIRENKRFIQIKKISDDRKKLLKIMVMNSLDISYLDTGKSFTLWYTPFKNERIDYKKLKIKGEQLYKQQNLEEALSIFTNLVEHGQFSSYTMARLGLICLNLNYLNWSIDYLTFATELSDKFNNNFDFSVLLAKLKKQETEYGDDRKYKVKFSENDFTQENDGYDIDNIDKIASMVLSGKSIKDACDSFNISNEQICLVYLLYVKEYYMNGDYEIGDKILKFVEKSEYKTDKVLQIVKDLRKNKKFYMYREDNSFRLIKK